MADGTTPHGSLFHEELPAAESIRVLDPSGVCQYETDDIQLAFAKVARLAAPSLTSGTPRWHEKGWRIVRG